MLYHTYKSAPLSKGKLGVPGTPLDDILHRPSGRIYQLLRPAESQLIFDKAVVLGVEIIQSAGDTRRVLDVHLIGDLVASSQQPVKILLVVSGRNAEASARGDQRGGRIADDDDGDLTVEHVVGEGWDLGRVIEHDGNDRRIIMAIDNVSETLETKTEVSRIKGDALQALLTLTRAELASDHLQ